MAGETFEVVAVDDPREVVRGAHVVSCATNSKVPVLNGDWLEPGQMVITIANSDVINARHEVDETTFARASEIIINDWDSVEANRQVELSEPIDKGLVKRENVHELGDIVAGKVDAQARSRRHRLLQEQHRARDAVRRLRRHPAPEAPGRGHQPHHPDGMVREREAAHLKPAQIVALPRARIRASYALRHFCAAASGRRPYSTTSVGPRHAGLFIGHLRAFPNHGRDGRKPEARARRAPQAQAWAERSAFARTLIVAGLVIGAIWLVAMSRWILTDSVVPWDSKNQFYAFYRFLASALDSGASPFWNPYHYGGHPSVADPQSLIFAPLMVLWALFDAAPSLRAFDLLVHAHLLIGGLAVAAIGARARWPVVACVLAAVVFMFGGAAAGRLQHTGIILSYGLFPLALLLLQLALERRSLVLGAAFCVRCRRGRARPQPGGDAALLRAGGGGDRRGRERRAAARLSARAARGAAS